MKYLKLSELPYGLYFWRKNVTGRHYKVAPDEIVNFENTSLNLASSISDDELILSDPNWCSYCWKEIPTWPPIGHCPFCKEDLSFSSIEQIKKEISVWTGESDPHI